MDPEERIKLEAQFEARLQARLAEMLLVFEAQLAEVRRVYETRITVLEAENAALRKKVGELSLKLGENSKNSHKPPSSDPPGSRPAGGKPSWRKRGGQKGHKGRHRELLPPDQVDKFEHLYPPECENCWAALPQVKDSEPMRTQHIELPAPKPFLTEYQRHAVACTCCGHVTRASCEAIPDSPFGPRVMAMLALLTGVYNLSRRRAVEAMKDMLGIDISLGAASAIEERVSNAVASTYDSVVGDADAAAVRHTDATTWLQSGKRQCVWVIATTMVTVFKIVADGTAELLEPLFKSKHGVLVSDRAPVFSFWKMSARQICWAHLLRKFVSFTERGGKAKAIGEELLEYARLVFVYWRDFKAGIIDDTVFAAVMAPVRQGFEEALVRAAMSDVDHVAGSCRDIIEHREALWNFIAYADVDPTNNHAERELRSFVLWRKRCFGSQSERGNRFAERLMTVAHTARKQRCNVLAFLTACCQSMLNAEPPPALLAQTAA